MQLLVSMETNLTESPGTSDSLSTSESVLSYLTTAPTSEFVEQTVNVIDGWEGNDNLLWRVTCGGIDAVLKLYLDAGQARSRRQFDGQQMFASLGIAPRPRWYDRYPLGLARQVLVYDWVPGDMLDVADQAAVMALAQTVAQIHGADAGEVHRFSPNALNLDYYWRMERGGFDAISHWLREQKCDLFFPIFSNLVEQSNALAEAALSRWAETPPCAVHGDLKLENCLTSFGAVVLLDWEKFGLGDPALEAASFLFSIQSQLDETMQDAWLDAYLAHADQAGMAHRIGIYRKLLPMRSVTYLLHGLRQMDLLAESAEVKEFLAATLQTSVAQTLLGFDQEPTNLEEAVSQLFA